MVEGWHKYFLHRFHDPGVIYTQDTGAHTPMANLARPGREDSGEPPKLNIEFRSKRTFQGGTDAVPFARIQIESNMNWFYCGENVTAWRLQQFAES